MSEGMDMTPAPAEEIAADTAARRRTARKLRTQARRAYAAIEGWSGMATPEDWERACVEAGEDYKSGRILLDQLGAERLMDPALMGTLWGLRQTLVEQLGARSAAESMLVDMAVLNYAMALRVNAMIGNAALTIENQFFGDVAPDVRLRERHGAAVAEKLSVEPVIERLRLQLAPLFDRANRGLIRNLQALRDLRQPPAPPVTIAQAGQVNLGAQQVNVAGRGGVVARPRDGAA